MRKKTISKNGITRLKWFAYYGVFQNAPRTFRSFGLSAQIFYPWKHRFDPYDLKILEESLCRPLQVRKARTRAKVGKKVWKLQEEYPHWGREKLGVFLKREGLTITGSTVVQVMRQFRVKRSITGKRRPKPGEASRKRNSPF